MFFIKSVLAAEKEILTCGGLDCSFCSLLESISNFYNLILAIAFAASIFFLSVAGIFYILNLGIKSAQVKAKRIFLSVLLGFGGILLGWIVIHTFLVLISYKNTDSFGSFKCDRDLQASESSLEQKDQKYNYAVNHKIFAYLSLGQYLESGDKMAKISGPLAASLFLQQLNEIKEGETLRFLAPAQETYLDEKSDVFAPLLTVQKENGKIKIKEVGEVLNNYLGDSLKKYSQNTNYGESNAYLNKILENSSNELESLFLKDSDGNLIGQTAFTDTKSQLMDALIEMVKEDTLKKARQLSDPRITDLVEEYIKNLDNPTKTSQILGEVLNKGVLEAGSDLIVERNDQLQSSEELNKVVRKEDLNIEEDTKESNNKTNSNSNANKEIASENQNQNKTVYPKVQDINNPPENSQSDKIDDLIDKTDRKPPPDSLDADDWLPGDGTKEAIKKALRRIEKRDPLRYKMVFQFVTHIGDVPGGGLCTGCGDIYVDRKAKIYDISHILIHEVTHSAHDCTVGWGGFQMSQIEAIACANQMGSVKREKVTDEDVKSAKKEDKTDDVKQMSEFPRQGKEITYKNIPVRGFLCRYLTKVNPKGDLGSWVLKQPRDYAVITHKYHNTGEYIYGDPEEGVTLNLAKTEEEVVKTVMTSKDKCKSSPPPDLPPVEDCKGAPEIIID